jgi:lysozyme
MKINQATVDLVKRFEGLELRAYRDPVGILTIGYGYTNRAGFGPGVKTGDVWTEEKAEEMLAEGLKRFGSEITPMFTRKPTDNQFGAMLSLAYNIGADAFSKSTCLRRFNSGDVEGAAEALTWFNKAGGKVLKGLVRRREAERDLFLSDSPPITNEGSAITPDAEKSKAQSTTLQAVAGAATAGAGGVATAVGKLDGTAQYIVIGTACVVALALLWIARERVRKWAAGDR